MKAFWIFRWLCVLIKFLCFPPKWSVLWKNNEWLNNLLEGAFIKTFQLALKLFLSAFSSKHLQSGSVSIFLFHICFVWERRRCGKYHVSDSSSGFYHCKHDLINLDVSNNCYCSSLLTQEGAKKFGTKHARLAWMLCIGGYMVFLQYIIYLTRIFSFITEMSNLFRPCVSILFFFFLNYKFITA